MNCKRQARKEAFQYMKNCCGDIYKLSFHFMEILAKYIPVAKDKPDEPSKPSRNSRKHQRNNTNISSMKLLSLIHKVCVGEQFEEYFRNQDFYANMNLHPCKCKLKIKTREKNTCVLPDIPDERKTAQTGQGQMEEEYPETCWILTRTTTSQSTRNRFPISQVTATRSSPKKWTQYSDNP